MRSQGGIVCSTDSCSFFSLSWLSSSDVVRLPIEHCKPNWRPKVFGVFRETWQAICAYVCKTNILAHLGGSCDIFILLSFFRNFCRIFFFAISYPITFCCCAFFSLSLSSSNSGRYLGTQLKNSGGNKWTYWVHSSHTHRWQV